MKGGRLTDNLRFAWIGVSSHALRSAMTALGIVIGIAAVIVLAALIDGVSRSVTRNIDSLGSNTLSVRAYTPLVDQMRGTTNKLTLEDYAVIQKAVDHNGTTSPTFFPYGVFGTHIKNAGTSYMVRVSAVSARHQDVTKQFVATGRFISLGDIKTRRRVCVIGADVAESLHLGANPVGKFIQMEDDWYKIIGVMKRRGQLFGLSQDDFALIPFSVGEMIRADTSQQDLVVNVNVLDPAKVGLLARHITKVLRRHQGNREVDAEKFKVQTADQLKETVTDVTDTISVALLGVVGISLLVGGIGIMNIMLVSVTERTREIGIVKALGAFRSDILLQFLTEATVISTLGGAAGFVLGICGVAILGLFVDGVSIFTVPIWAMVLSVGVSVAVGMLFGLLPAVKAANLMPIDALRFE